MKRKLSKIVVYYRQRTPSENQTPFGVRSARKQIISVQQLAESAGAVVVGTYTEIETRDARRDRPELKNAIRLASQRKATLVIAKFGRLVNDLRFLSALQKANVDFLSCDAPDANMANIQKMLVDAEHKARQKARRTRDALAVARANGVRLGSARKGHWKGRENKRGWKQANAASIVARQQLARDAYSPLIEPMRRLREVEGYGLVEIAEWLNEQGHLTTRQRPFTATAVHRILRMFDEEPVTV